MASAVCSATIWVRRVLILTVAQHGGALVDFGEELRGRALPAIRLA
jgi:hypothetical protein